MSRLIFLFAVIALVYLLLRAYRKSMPERDKRITEDMVRCAHCGLHLPRDESVRFNGEDFCSLEHKDAFWK